MMFRGYYLSLQSQEKQHSDSKLERVYDNDDVRQKVSE